MNFATYFVLLIFIYSDLVIIGESNEVIPNASEKSVEKLTSSLTPARNLKSTRHRLRSSLLDSYDVNVHPRYNHSDPVVVGLGMGLIHLDISEKTSTVNIDAWMRLTWKDEYLQWDPVKYDNLTKIHFSVGEIWNPDVLLYNNANPESINPYKDTHFLVENTGQVLWVPPAYLKAFCKLDLRKWPLDSQTCKLKFGSWTSHADQIDLTLYKNMSHVERLDFYTRDRQWQVTSTDVIRNSVTYPDHPDTYTDITFTFYVKRESPAYRAIIILPCLVCSFALPSTSYEKLTLNTMALLGSIIYMVYFATILPFQYSAVPIIVMFYSNTVTLIGIAILLNVIVLNMTKVRKHVHPPKFFRALFSGPLGKFLCLGHYYHQISPTHQRLDILHELTDMAESEQQHAEESEANANRQRTTDGEEPVNTFTSNDIMSEWLLIASGMEKICLIIYGFAFAVVSYAYT